MMDKKLILKYKLEIEKTKNLANLDNIRIKLFGKSGIITNYINQIKNLPQEERKSFGKIINTAKQELLELFNNKKLELENLGTDFVDQKIDLTIPSIEKARGSVHPISQVLYEIFEILSMFGFSIIEGNSIESDWYNFGALNFGDNHPAREMQDTFYVGESLLRTHTSNMQIRTMENQSPPFYFISPGRVYRRDDIDMTHSAMFHQIECVVVDKGVHMGHLKSIVETMLKVFFAIDGLQIRFRPSFFPFTEPSGEFDIKLEKDGSWLEIMGCGMIHPNVLKNVSVDSNTWQGFAFGLGVERLAMLKYNIKDIRQFFNSDKRWLNHYSFSAFDIPSLLGGLRR